MGARGRTRRGAAAAAVLCALVVPGGVAAAPEPRCDRSVQRVEGGTWTTTPIQGISGAYSGWEMAVDPLDPRLILVADPDGVLVSDDGGCSWTRTVVFDEVAPEWSLRAADAVVARGADGRSLHVLAFAAGNARTLVLSSADDGRTWASAELPPDSNGVTPDGGAITSASHGGPLYVHLQHRTTTGALLRSDDAGATWENAALTTLAPSGICPPGHGCTAPPLLQVEPAAAASLWGLAAPAPGEPERVVRSADAGTTWEDVEVPRLNGGTTLLDVVASPRRLPSVLLLGDFGEFALSRDGGASWEAGEFPTLSDGQQQMAASHDVAHTLDGRSFATLSGLSRGPWSGNVVVFDGREWTNVAPEPYAGFDRRDDDGNPLLFTELAGGRGSFSMLASPGLLATFRPGR
jgi:photosystem II stability/assembly factor-like uncharacterized protein